MGGVDGHVVAAEAQRIEPPEDFVAQRIGAHATDDIGPRAERLGMIGEVGRRPAELLSAGQEVPEDFAQADDDWPTVSRHHRPLQKS